VTWKYKSLSINLELNTFIILYKLLYKRTKYYGLVEKDDLQ